MKNSFIVVLSLILICTILVSCSSLKGTKDITRLSYRDFNKVAENLYEITVDDYDMDYAKLSESEALNLQKFACSSVRNGNFYGRSFDFVYEDGFELVVHTTKAPGRYESVAMGCTQNVKNIDILKNHLDNDVAETAVLVLTDGINENGVVCNINVVPVIDTECPTTGTNPGKEDLGIPCLIRFVLDNAKSAKHAVRLLKNRNITGGRDYFHTNEMGYELHMMVADEKDTYVIEFVNNEMKVLKDQKIMTNYYLSLDAPTPHGSGVERYEILSKNYDMATSAEGMAKLMEMVKFTKSYTTPLYSDYYEKTPEMDYCSETLPLWKDSIDKFSKTVLQSIENDMAQHTNSAGYWITMHMTVYDIANRTMRAIVQERYNEPHTFTL